MVLLPRALPSPLTQPLVLLQLHFFPPVSLSVMTHLSVTFKLRDKQDSQGVRLLVSVNHSLELDAFPKIRQSVLSAPFLPLTAGSLLDCRSFTAELIDIRLTDSWRCFSAGMQLNSSHNDGENAVFNTLPHRYIMYNILIQYWILLNILSMWFLTSVGNVVKINKTTALTLLQTLVQIQLGEKLNFVLDRHLNNSIPQTAALSDFCVW